MQYTHYTLSYILFPLNFIPIYDMYQGNEFLCKYCVRVVFYIHVMRAQYDNKSVSYYFTGKNNPSNT